MNDPLIEKPPYRTKIAPGGPFQQGAVNYEQDTVSFQGTYSNDATVSREGRPGGAKTSGGGAGNNNLGVGGGDFGEPDPNVQYGQMSPQEILQQKQWLTEAYEDFKNRLTYKYLVAHDATNFTQLQERLKMVPGNASPEGLFALRCFAWTCFPLIVPIVYLKTRTIFEVDKNHFALVVCRTEGGARTRIYGPGFHKIGFFNKLQGIYSFDKNYQRNIVESEIGDLKIVKVVQGTIAHFDSGGQNIILGPGIHVITEPMVFIKTVNLDSFYIEIGPEKWVTVPTGYDGISINRGQIKILEGGKQHHLPHIGDKFVKMVPKTLQTDRVPSDIPGYIVKLEKGEALVEGVDYDPMHYLKTTTAEGASVHLDCMIFWQIVDTDLAARTAIQFLDIGNEYDPSTHTTHQAIRAASENISQMRGTVLRIAKNHLTALVGTCSLASKFSLGADIQSKSVLPTASTAATPITSVGLNFSAQQQQIDQNADAEEAKSDTLSKQAQYLPQRRPTAPVPNENNRNFQILQFLQDNCKTLKDIINDDLSKIGVFMSNICIFSVVPTRDIQLELDKQTKARVDMNTAMIQVQTRQQANTIEQQIEQQRAMQTARNNAEIVKLQAQAQSEAEVMRADAQAEAIIRVARARKLEAEELQAGAIARELALVRAAGEAGEKIFSGKSNNFVYAKDPGDILFSLF